MPRRNPKGRDINGVILLDKDTGLSSNAALQKVKRLFFAKKAGHTGSLDPLASGILPICLGQSTKIAQFLLNDDKRYFVRGKLGQTTETGDSEGKCLKIQTLEFLDEADIVTTVQSFIGNILQVPPMYSALKKDGQPLYKLARQGISVERKARPVSIHAINYLGYENGILSLDVACSKGTYIRTLIEDIGNKLNCGAHVIELRRTGFAHIDITQTIKLSQLKALVGDDFAQLDANLIKSESLLPDFESIYLNDKQSIDIKYGRSIQYYKEYLNTLQKIKLFDGQQQFIGIGQIQENGIIAPKKLFI